MKISKKQLYLSLISLAILIVSLVLTLCNALIPWNIWGGESFRKILFFVFCIFVGFGILCAFIAGAEKSPWYFFISAILIGLALLYALLAYIPWYLDIIIFVCLLAVVSILSFIVAGRETEDIALNKSSDYKNYEQRKEEKEKLESKEEKELPKIKSFKE